jgi:hypothetical protein
MSAIVRHEQTGLAQVDIASELPAIFTLAKALVKAGGFMPSHLKTEGEIVAVVLAGRELGVAPMAAIRSIKLIKGNVTLDASMQLALMVRAGCKVEWLEDGSKGKAELRLERPGQPPHISRFSMEDAQRAGLAGSDNWRKHPAAMLRARCVTAAGKAYCPDVLAGVYLPDELPDSDARQVATLPVRAAEPIDATPEPSPATFDAATGEIVAEAEPTGPSSDEQIYGLVNVDLPQCSTFDQLVAWAQALIAVHGPVRGTAPWKAFQARCADREVSPRDVVNAASKG